MSEVINKSVKLIQALKPDEFEYEWSATEISKKVDMPVQTVHRLLSSLEKNGFVYKNKENRKFRLGLGLMQLGLSIWEGLSILNISRPLMEKLADKTQESVYLTVREGNDGIFVECINSPQMLRIAEPLGMRLPLCHGASKKVILAYMKPSAQERVIKGLIRTGILKTERELDLLLDELTLIKQQGYSISTSETTHGTSGVAAPIFAWNGQVEGAVSVAGPEIRFRANYLNRIINAVKETAFDISDKMGWVDTSHK
ncbi:IclR family transcriptional regulator [Gracilibacillus oryzae]|uniref:IclR family transcriptional regulator n=1 Tax=Gracilibacillus oryzae TaxID=1672701 RepID=A0A7C8KU88_9BACI|nr:IclR family transcriptional regulator [Gracilibacillus oryzae]KAB8136741.1 IclR family transcriptional regulator [Gracilibacillus oryzae]